MADGKDSLAIAGKILASRMALGTARYPSPAVLADCVEKCNPGFITVSLRRTGKKGSGFFDLLSGLGVPLVPNTAGCRTAKEACQVASMARELLATDWIKLEVIADDDTLAPDPFGLVEAAADLAKDGFCVLAYCTEDLALCNRLAEIGCGAIMPWGSPIGSGQGITHLQRLEKLRSSLPGQVLVVDAGIGRPSDAAQAMEIGFDGVLLNTAVALAGDPAAMAGAFAKAVDAGRTAHLARIMPRHQMAVPSTPPPDAVADSL